MTDPTFIQPRRGRPPRVRIEGREDPDYDPAFQAASLLDEPESPGGPAAETETVALVTPDGWFDMVDAPQDGKAIWLLGSESVFTEAVWRHTRMYDKRGGKWRTVGFWAIRNAGGTPVPFEPVAWRPL